MTKAGWLVAVLVQFNSIVFLCVAGLALYCLHQAMQDCKRDKIRVLFTLLATLAFSCAAVGVHGLYILKTRRAVHRVILGLFSLLLIAALVFSAVSFREDSTPFSCVVSLLFQNKVGCDMLDCKDCYKTSNSTLCPGLTYFREKYRTHVFGALGGICVCLLAGVILLPFSGKADTHYISSNLIY